MTDSKQKSKSKKKPEKKSKKQQQGNKNNQVNNDDEKSKLLPNSATTNQDKILQSNMMSSFNENNFFHHLDIITETFSKNRDKEKHNEDLKYKIPGDFDKAKKRGIKAMVSFRGFIAKIKQTQMLYTQYKCLDNPNIDEMDRIEQNAIIQDRLIYEFGINVKVFSKQVKSLKKNLDEGNYDEVERILSEVMPLGTQANELSFLGTGYSFYFLVIQFCLQILFTMFIVTGFSSMIINFLYGTKCIGAESLHCGQSLVTQSSLGNVHEGVIVDAMQLQVLATMIVIMIQFQFFRLKLRQMAEEIDTATVTPSDYAVRIDNIPVPLKKIKNINLSNMCHNEQQEKILKIQLEEQFQKVGIKIKVMEILFFKNYDKLQLVKNQRQEVISAKKKAYLDNSSEHELQEFDKQIADKNSQIQSFLSHSEEPCTSTAIVSLYHEKQKDRIVAYQQKYKSIKIQNNVLEINQAREPTDIFWENQHYTNFQRRSRLFTGTIFGFIVVCLSFTMTFSLKYWLRLQEPSVYNSIAIATIISFANQILYILIRKIVTFEKHIDKSSHNFKLILRLTLVYFINTGLCHVISFMWSAESYNYKDIYGYGGIIFNQNSIFLANIYVPILIRIFNYAYYQKKGKRILIRKNKNPNETQQELDESYINPEFNLADDYANVIKTMFMTALFSIILPIGIIWSVLSLTGMYWMAKYNLLRKSIVTFDFSVKLGTQIIELLEYILPIYGISCLIVIFYSIDYPIKLNNYMLIGIAVTLIHNFLPMDTFNEWIFKVNPAQATRLTYSQAKEKIWTNKEDYEDALYNYYDVGHHRELKHHHDE